MLVQFKCHDNYEGQCPLVMMLTLQSSPRVAVEEEEEGNTLVVRGVTQLDEVVIIAIHCNLIYLMFVCFDDSFFRPLTPVLCPLSRRLRSNIRSQ